MANETRERKGLGPAFYRSLADYAKANGMRLLAGVESTPSAQKVQDELIASGGARIVSAEEVFGPDAAPGVTEAMTANPYEDGRARQLVEILPTDSRLDQTGSESSPRGYITFNDAKPGTQRKFQITVTARRDLSTLLHEFGHYYLEVVNELASDGTASQKMIDDVAAIRQWTGAAPTGPFAVEQHEQFARGFEAYLAEGKAPNPEIQGAFSRFKRWIIAIYKDLVRLNVELTPEIRGVMDRIVATDEQITASEQVTQAIPMFDTAAKAGMTEEEFLQYRNQVELAHAEAAETMEQQIIREEERRNSKWWSDETARVAKEVSEELDTMPEYQAIRALRTGAMPDGTTQKIKLQGSEIKEIYGTAVLRKLAFMHGKDGVPMDIAA